MKVKKFTTIILLLFCIISLVSCGAPSSVKQEAEERLEKYKPLFEQKVEDVYTNNGDKDAFDIYGIRNAISIKLNPGDLVYNYMD